MIRIFTLKEKSGLVNLEYAMIWRGAKAPAVEDFKTHWGDFLYLPWHETSTAVELVPIDGSKCLQFDASME